MEIKTQAIDNEIEQTKNMDDFIRDDENLKREYDNLNTYCNFAVKSLKYFIPKIGKGLKGSIDETNIQSEISNLKDNEEISPPEDPFEVKVIEKTSKKINDLFINSMIEASEKFSRLTNEELDETLNEEEKKMHNELENNKKNFSILGNIEEPNEDEQNEKLNKFRSYLVSDFKKCSTPQLLSQIVEIINNTYVDEIKTRNNLEEEDDVDELEKNSLHNVEKNNESKIYK